MVKFYNLLQKRLTWVLLCQMTWSLQNIDIDIDIEDLFYVEYTYNK